MPTFINIHTHHTTADGFAIQNIFLAPALQLPLQYQTFYSVGLHPWHLTQLTATQQVALQLQEALKHSPNIIAIGETGIDRAIQTSLAVQQAVFQIHITMSEQYNLPLIIHCVRAYADMLALLKQYTPQQIWIFHGFQANVIQLKDFLKYKNCYFSFGKSLLTSNKVQAVFLQTPMHRCFLETDDQTGLTIQTMYEWAAHLRGMTVESLCNQLLFNFETVWEQVLDRKS